MPVKGRPCATPCLMTSLGFGDEMEILVNAQPSRAPAGVIAGNASQWQMCVNTAKSRLGGFGVPGLIEAEPRASPTAWPIYR